MNRLPTACRKLFAVCLHDAAPGSERAILRQWEALHSVIGAPPSIAVIPAAAGPSWATIGTAYRESLGRAERLLHGFHHSRPDGRSLVSRACGRVDEFAGLARARARQRLADGQQVMTDLFGRPAAGFLPPAWQAGPVDASLLADSGLRFAVGFRRLRPRAGPAVPLATFTWDFGPIPWLGHVGAPLGLLLRLQPGAVPVVALHPCDEARGFLRPALALVRRLLDTGHRPVPFDALVPEPACAP